jgi:hypothetical protein
MILAPYGVKHGTEGWGSFFSGSGLDVSSNGIRFGEIGSVKTDMLILQSVFLAVLFSVIVNIRWRPSRRVLIWFAVCAALLLIVCFGFPAFQNQMKAGVCCLLDRHSRKSRKFTTNPRSRVCSASFLLCPPLGTRAATGSETLPLFHLGAPRRRAQSQSRRGEQNIVQRHSLRSMNSAASKGPALRSASGPET